MRSFLPNSWSFKEQITYLRKKPKNKTHFSKSLHYFFKFQNILSPSTFYLTEAADWEYSFSG